MKDTKPCDLCGSRTGFMTSPEGQQCGCGRWVCDNCVSWPDSGSRIVCRQCMAKRKTTAQLQQVLSHPLGGAPNTALLLGAALSGGDPVALARRLAKQQGIEVNDERET